MKEYYKQSCELILKYKDHREPLIRRTVITLIPAMGTYDQQGFEEVFLHRSMAHLQGQLSKPGERDAGRKGQRGRFRELVRTDIVMVYSFPGNRSFGCESWQ
jgi:hypothetical protein